MAIIFIHNRNNEISRKKENYTKNNTLITTDVTPLLTQKYVPDLQAYCFENFLIISRDLLEGSTGG